MTRSTVTSIGGQHRQPTGGTVLLEILLATGLLGIVTGCLLTAFQQTRGIETQIRENLASLEESNRLVGLLRQDLLRTRLIVWDGGADPATQSLSLLVREDEASMGNSSFSSLVRYGWDTGEQCLMRTTEGGEGQYYTLPVSYRGPIDFELIPSDAGSSSPKGAAEGMYLAGAVRIRTPMPLDLEESISVPADSTREVATLPLPVPVPVVLPEEVSL